MHTCKGAVHISCDNEHCGISSEMDTRTWMIFVERLPKSVVISRLECVWKPADSSGVAKHWPLTLSAPLLIRVSHLDTVKISRIMTKYLLLSHGYWITVLLVLTYSDISCVGGFTLTRPRKLRHAFLQKYPPNCLCSCLLNRWPAYTCADTQRPEQGIGCCSERSRNNKE